MDYIVIIIIIIIIIIIMKGNQLESGTYTAIFEIFVIGDAGGFSC